MTKVKYFNIGIKFYFVDMKIEKWIVYDVESQEATSDKQ